MKTILFLFTSALLFSGAVFAADDMDKIDTDFQSLDNDGNGYLSKDETDDNAVADHFDMIDTNSDSRISQTEFNTYTTAHPDQVEQGEEIPQGREQPGQQQ